ncbi:hypothetical protein BDW74DRAFT_152279 [Aspergillus multicolor]|uniref:uncharacterized protein n=1 Tax=Aspergillus multicolor TaxID=41759 RepID=UPI003CCD641E
MPRTVYLAVFSNGSRPAHQSVFVPTGNTGTKGKLIHVDGNPAYGFSLEFLRNFDFADFPTLYRIIELGAVDDRFVTDTPGNGQLSKDAIARDRMESVATLVPPPGRGLNPFDPAVGISRCKLMKTF